MKAAFHTLGCKVNSYETQAIKEQFLALGFEEASFDEASDVYVVNTCSVTQVAERKSRQMLHRARSLAPESLIVAAGCYVQEDAESLLESKDADIVVGNSEKSRIAEIVLEKLEERKQEAGGKTSQEEESSAAENKKEPEKSLFSGKSSLPLKGPEASVEESPQSGTAASLKKEDGNGQAGLSAGLKASGRKNSESQAKDRALKNLYVEDLRRSRDFESQKISGAGDHVRAYIKIQDGCDRFCSYCIIPYLRGRSRSRAKAEILSEAQTLANNGYKEIILTGIDVSDYRQEDLRAGDESFSDLIKACAGISGIERIRLGSLECSLITSDFISSLKGVPQFCPQFHLSLQSGSDTVLKRMNRKYTSGEYFEKTELIRKYFPGAAITTDIIVGFPKESEEEFEETCAFVKKVGFSRTHVFKYSLRKGTRAAAMEGQIDGNIKAERSEALIGITKSLQKEYEEKLVGREVSVLIEEKTEDGLQAGYTPEYVKIAVKSSRDLVNQIVTVIPVKFTDTEEGKILLAETKS